MNKQLETFFDNTKIVYIAIIIALLLLIFSIIISNNVFRPLVILIKILIVFILIVCLYKNTNETTNFVKNTIESIMDKCGVTHSTAAHILICYDWNEDLVSHLWWEGENDSQIQQ